MADDLTSSLKALTASDLRSIAEKAGIDVSSCKSKRDYVRVISQSSSSEKRIRQLLQAAPSRTGGKAADMEDVKNDLEEISARSSSARDVPEEEDMEVERSIDKALLLRPLFFEIDSNTERAWNRMILGDFAEAMKLNIKSRAEAVERLTNFYLYSAALSIRAAETLLRDMKELDSRMGSELRTALAEAKMAFIHGPPKRREDAVEEIEALTVRAVESFMTRTSGAEQELREMLEEYASFGVRTRGSHELLDIALNAKRSCDLGQYSDLMAEARAQAERDKEARLREIDDAFEQVRTAIEAAKAAGADTKGEETGLKDAKKAMKRNDFREAIELLAAIERTADSAHLHRVRSNGAVEAREIEEITSSIRESEPGLEEAARYGLDVQEGLLFVRRTKDALEHRDVVTASKYSMRMRRLTKSMEGDVKRLRTAEGAPRHVAGARCGQCGRESLYAYLDGRTSCDECGHSFSSGPSGDGTAPPSGPSQARPLKSSSGKTTGASKQRRRRSLVKK
ncbi:MAG: TFIIB-type zinc finger domain-containing protein [Methanobacteriota archaeon]|nr:MAG: TFIIB-type zinc finger domain-containing protein [Euryarchaeota archaeon]